MNLEKLKLFLKKNKQPDFRIKQISKAICQDGLSSFLEITTIPLDLRKGLEKEMGILSFKLEKILVSDDKKSAKALLKLADNNYLETVLLSPRPETWTACVSSQAGCPLKCAFCATGRMGFKRNLTAEEITDQILFWRQYLNRIAHNAKRKAQVNNIVFMGMGEPFLNWEEVKKSVENLADPKLFGFGSRSISISTVGVPQGIEKFLNKFPQVNLAISLHFSDDESRSRFMPSNKQFNLDDLKKSLKNYFKKSQRKIFIEYIMFAGLNDSLDDAKKLVAYLNSIGNSYLLHVNLIPYNSHNVERGTRNVEHGTRNIFDYKSSSKEKIIGFRNYLLKNKINATIRKSLGSEIQGACGQLAPR